MSISIPSLVIGMLLAAVISAAAWKAGALSLSGAIAAGVLGTVIFGLGGLTWSVLLLAFFISSSVLSRMFGRRKKKLNEKFSKGSRRDWAQVAANGGAAGLFVLLNVFIPGSFVWTWAAYAGALAAANADTWATELGVLSRTAPRLITTGKPVERGTSGGISLVGSLASLAGSMLIALLAVFLWNASVTLPVNPLSLSQSMRWFAVISLAGFSGSLFDSLLGATLQAIYFCPSCEKETERYPVHSCGCATRPLRGWPWLDNDWVNTACTLVGALVPVAGFLLIP